VASVAPNRSVRGVGVVVEEPFEAPRPPARYRALRGGRDVAPFRGAGPGATLESGPAEVRVMMDSVLWVVERPRAGGPERSPDRRLPAAGPREQARARL